MPASARARTFDVKSVAIIGAGPSGLATAKYLLAEKRFKRIDIFEQRTRVGGAWDYDPNQKSYPTDLPIPQTNPHTGHAKPTSIKKDGQPQWTSPLYDRLETNIPRGLMGFRDLDWPKDSQLFPKHETVTEYIEKYAEDVRHLIRFHTQVTRVAPLHPGMSDGHGWRVETKDVRDKDDSSKTSAEYDAVVAANGHFFVPFVPEIKGLNEFSRKHPGIVSHSMYFKRPEQYQGQKVICVGNGASGVDIATQIMSCCKWPLLISQRSESFFLKGESPSKQDRPEIVEFISQDRAVRFADGSIETDVDGILFCTGYLYSFPFLDNLDPPLIGDGTHVQNTYQHLFYRPNATLAFPVLQQRVIPFPMAEVQAAVLARVWSGRLATPSEQEMKSWEDERYKETGGGRAFHLLGFPKDADYINAMYDFAMSAEDGETEGKEPPRWDAESYWLRERFPTIKRAFADKGDDRRDVKHLEELGFDYEAFQRERQDECKSLI
ncbi:hypothetical protein MBLNU457_g2945t1 [Dothideomycetes sp. NU457]